MELIRTKNIEEFNNYVATSYKPHFMQTATWGEVNETRGALSHMLFLKDNEKIIGSAMLLEKKVLNYSTFYCPRGFITNYDNKNDIKNMIFYLKEYVNKNNGIYLKIDPDIIIRKLNSECEIIEELKDKLELIEYLKELGGKHRGFVKKLSESSAPRYTFRVHVDKEDLLASFHPRVRNLLHRDNPYGLNIFIGDENDLDKFYVPMKDTAIRKKMYLEDQKYFNNFYKILHKYNMADLYVVTANKTKLNKKYNELKDNANKEIDKIKQTNKQGKLSDYYKQLEKYDKELNLINSIKDEEIILSSMINAKFKDKVWTIHGANSSSLPFLKANYEMYWQIMKDAKDQGYKEVDFYGTEGEIDKNSDAYGIFEFKYRFNGDFDEFIGEFDFITKPIPYVIITTLLKIRRKLKYQFQKIKNK